MPVPPILVIAPAPLGKPKVPIAPKFDDAEIKSKGLACAYQQVCKEIDYELGLQLLIKCLKYYQDINMVSCANFSQSSPISSLNATAISVSVSVFKHQQHGTRNNFQIERQTPSS